jgi:alpha-tubulin suppressor-like RCC1 family protein
MSTNFQIDGADFDDTFIRKDLFTQGGLWGWGSNFNGQLGTGNRTHRSSPVQTITGGTNWTRVSAGTDHTAAIKTDGTLWTWGSNGNGRLGDNSGTVRSSPVQTVSAGTNWKQVDCGENYTAAIKTDGTLWLWGANAAGQLGTGNITQRSSPVQTLGGGTNWKTISVGSLHIAAIKTDGSLWLWGSNNGGQLGDNTNAVRRSSPVQTVSGGVSWLQVSAGYNHTAAIKTDGTLWLWGSNINSQLGISGTDRSSPVQTVSAGTNWKQVATGHSHTVAIKTDGTLWTWGSNSRGELGDGTVTRRSSPVQTVSAGTNWKQVSAGYNYTTAIKTDGTLWTWGSNGNGQLATGNITHRSSPVQTVSAGTNWKQVSAGYTHMMGIRIDFY